jgi:hypothetical protein
MKPNCHRLTVLLRQLRFLPTGCKRSVNRGNDNKTKHINIIKSIHRSISTHIIPKDHKVLAPLEARQEQRQRAHRRASLVTRRCSPESISDNRNAFVCIVALFESERERERREQTKRERERERSESTQYQKQSTSACLSCRSSSSAQQATSRSTLAPSCCCRSDRRLRQARVYTDLASSVSRS